MIKVCIHWPRFGPYHIARLRAASAVFASCNAELVALETATADRIYEWQVLDEAEPFPRVVALPGRVFEEVAPGEMERAVIASLDRIKPDAVAITSYGYPDARAALRWTREHRRIAIMMTDSKEDDAPRSWWRERIKKVLVGQFDAALVGGSLQRRYAVQLGLPKAVVFEGANAVDNALFRDAAQRYRTGNEPPPPLPGLGQRRPYFLAVSRLLPDKNLDRLVDGYAQYRQMVADPWDLLVVGDGPHRGQLEANIAGSSIRGITLCGFRQSHDLACYYALAGAFVHPTLKDTWGLVVNEAMAAGLPVLVSTRAGCHADLVEEGGNGFVFDPLNVEQMAALLVRISAPSIDRHVMGLRSQEIANRYSPERFARQLLRAVEAGRARAQRPLNPAARVVLGLLRALARRPDSFQSIPEIAYSASG